MDTKIACRFFGLFDPQESLRRTIREQRNISETNQQKSSEKTHQNVLHVQQQNPFRKRCFIFFRCFVWFPEAKRGHKYEHLHGFQAAFEAEGLLTSWEKGSKLETSVDEGK